MTRVIKRYAARGSAAGNIITFVALLAMTIPDVPVLPLLAVLVPIAGLAPIVYYPFSKTVSVAIDRAYLQRLDPQERSDEQHPRGRPGAPSA